MQVAYLPYDDVGITLAVIGIAMAFIVLVWNAVKAIHDWRNMAKKPTDDKINDHEGRLLKLESWREKADEKLADDWAFRQDEALVNTLMLRSIKELLQHELDGNNSDELKVLEKDIDTFLVQASQKQHSH